MVDAGIVGKSFVIQQLMVLQKLVAVASIVATKKKDYVYVVQIVPKF
jgi:hypothetical protein